MKWNYTDNVYVVSKDPAWNRVKEVSEPKEQVKEATEQMMVPCCIRCGERLYFKSYRNYLETICCGRNYNHDSLTKIKVIDVPIGTIEQEAEKIYPN